MSFLNPGLLFGALLFAVPLIIHLLNRQRYKRREWAAMEFLLLAFKKQRRRLRTENLLLLLLRCLIPIIIALAIARPVLRGDLAGAGLGGSAHHILILDHSYSMGYAPESAQSPFARMRQLAGELLESLESQSGSKVTLVMAGIRTAMPVMEDLNLTRAKAEVAKLESPQDSATDLTEALGQVADLIERGGEIETVVYVFTDMQVRAFGADLEEAPGTEDDAQRPPALDDPEARLFDDTARDLFERISQNAEIALLDVGGLANDAAPATADNVQITNLRLDAMVAVARNAVPIVATIRNRSDVSRTVQVTLEVDGAQPTRKSVRVDADAEAQAEFLVIFRETGLRHLQANLDGDGLTSDDDRFLVVNVRDRIRLLIVEGTAETDPGLMESEHLRSVLDPTRGEGAPEVTVFAPKVIDSIQFLSNREPLQDYDLVVLANVERLNESAATSLKEAMLGGTGLWVMLGDLSDPASFNLHLGDGPMPMQLTGERGYKPGENLYYETTILKPDHPVFSGFVEDVYQEAFQLTPVYRFVGSTDEEIEDGEVLVQIRDEYLSPLFVASRHGAGKALFTTSAISALPNRWNRLDLIMLALPLFHETVRWLTLPALDPYNAMTGTELTATLRERPERIYVLMPKRAGGRRQAVGGDSRALPGGRFALPAFRETEFAGVYTMEMQVDAGGGMQDQQLFFAVNPDADEGDLTYLSHAAARENLGVQTILRRLPSNSAGAIQAGSSDLGVPMLYLALLILVGEASLARFVSRRRSA